MKKLNESVRTFAQKSYAPYVVYFVAVLVYHFFIRGGWCDDEWYATILDIENMNIKEFLLWRYETWTTRLLVEAATVTMANALLLWKIIDSLMMLLVAYALVQLFGDGTARFTCFVCTVLVLLPTKMYQDTGWVATTTNYLWPCALGLYALIAIKKTLANQKIKAFEYVLSFLAVNYACNAQQMCAILVCLFAIFFVYALALQKKVRPFLLFMFVVCTAWLIFGMVGKGNEARLAFSIERYFPDFASLSLFTKLEMGYSSTLFEYIMKPNVLFVLFAVLLCAAVFARQTPNSINQSSPNQSETNAAVHAATIGVIYDTTNDITNVNPTDAARQTPNTTTPAVTKAIRWVASIPLIATLVFGAFSVLSEELFPVIALIRDALGNYGTGVVLSSPKTLFPDMIVTLVILCVFVALYWAFAGRRTALFSMLVFAAGFCSRMVMSFSPTIWASGVRTFFFMYQALVVCILLLYKSLKDSGAHRVCAWSENAVYVLCFLSVLNIL